MLERIFRHHEVTGPERLPVSDDAPECSHLMLRPRWDTGGYVCEGCLRRFTADEAEQLCSEAPLHALHAGA